MHKRLALIYISDAGFNRLIDAALAAPLPDGFWQGTVSLYFASDLLMIGLGVYDLSIC